MSTTLPTRGGPALLVPPPPRRVTPQDAALAVLLGAAATGLLLAHVRWPGSIPLIALVPICVGASIFLPARPAQLLLTYVGVAVLGLALLTPRDRGVPAILLVVSILLLLAVTRSRATHGVAPFDSDRMLGDLRARLERLGRVPALPAGWTAERAHATAHGDSFAGDFLITHLDEDRSRLHLVLADVSGKGQQAGSRAVALSGVMSGLLGTVPPDQLLRAADAALDREGWEEGFATAVLVEVDLRTGQAWVASAGHPPAVHRHGGSGRWSVVEGAGGPALGIGAARDYPVATLILGRGDALLVCTDGVVESPRGSLDDGVDWMLGVADAAVVDGIPGLAGRLVHQARAGEDDDRAAVVLWRD